MKREMDWPDLGAKIYLIFVAGVFISKYLLKKQDLLFQQWFNVTLWLIIIIGGGFFCSYTFSLSVKSNFVIALICLTISTFLITSLRYEVKLPDNTLRYAQSEWFKGATFMYYERVGLILKKEKNNYSE